MKSERAVGWTHIPQEVNSLGEHIVSLINVVKYQLIMDETDELIKLHYYSKVFKLLSPIVVPSPRILRLLALREWYYPI